MTLRPYTLAALLLGVASLPLVALTHAAPVAAAEDAPPATIAQPNDPLVDAFTRVEAASVADAIEQLYGQRLYLPHDFRALEPGKFAGRAMTVELRREENKDGGAAIKGMLDAIDAGQPGSVYVMAMDQGADFAGMGGLMATAMKARGYVGALVDGGVRDLPQIERLRFPVVSRSIVPSTTVNHYRFVASQQPVMVGGVRIAPGDIIVSDLDGTVVVPKEHAEEILKKAQALDYAEHSMYPYIEKYRSIGAAVAKFGRI